MLNNNPVLMDRHFQYNAEVFFKELYLIVRRGKHNFMLHVLNFKKELAHMVTLIWIFNAPNIENVAPYI